VAALAYLTIRSASVAEVKKVLDRRIRAWAKKTDDADVERATGFRDAVLERLKASGLLNDAAYAERRAASLSRSGKSRRAVEFDLARRGVSESIAKATVPNDAALELESAVALMRKKRLGPFSKVETPDQKLRHRWLGAFARAGFSLSVASRALKLDLETAENLLKSLRAR
jgi:regulatory protein